MNSNITRYAFLCGAAYFICMAIAHFFVIKVPILFVYYDTPFYAYQDKIISFAVCAYIALFYSASKHRDVALTAIIVLALTVAGLSAVNLSSEFAKILTAEQSTLPYWLQTIAITFYLFVLVFLYLKDAKKNVTKNTHHQFRLVTTSLAAWLLNMYLDKKQAVLLKVGDSNDLFLALNQKAMQQKEFGEQTRSLHNN